MFKISNELLAKIKQAIKPAELAVASGVSSNGCFGCSSECVSSCRGGCHGSCSGGCLGTCSGHTR